MSNQHVKSATHEYVVAGPTAGRPDTLLKAHNVSDGLWDIFRGKKVLARVAARSRGSRELELVSGKVNLESAKDAIFILDLELKQQRDAKKLVLPESMSRPKSQRVVLIPQVIVTLAPDGTLQAELPSGGSVRRVVSLRKDAETSLKRILQEQLEGNISIGQDGAPTEAQVRHWQDHQMFPNPRCPFCLSEGLIKGTPKRQQRSQLISKSKDVEIRRLTAVVKRKRGEAIRISTDRVNVEDLDL